MCMIVTCQIRFAVDHRASFFGFCSGAPRVLRAVNADVLGLNRGKEGIFGLLVVRRGAGVSMFALFFLVSSTLL